MKHELVKLHQIVSGTEQNVNPNARVDFGEIEQLAESIFHHGLENPLRATVGKPVNGEMRLNLVDGDRRFAACILLEQQGRGLKNIPVLVTKDTNKERNLLQWILNDGKHLGEFEKAEIVRREVKQGAKLGNIAAEMGKTESYVSQLNWLNTLPDWIIQAGKEGKVAATLCWQLKAEYGEGCVAQLEAQRATIEAIGATAKSFKFPKLEAKALAKAVKNQPVTAPASVPTPTPDGSVSAAPSSITSPGDAKDTGNKGAQDGGNTTVPGDGKSLANGGNVPTTEQLAAKADAAEQHRHGSEAETKFAAVSVAISALFGMLCDGKLNNDTKVAKARMMLKAANDAFKFWED